MKISENEVILINNILPKQINLDIIKLLCERSWKIGFDVDEKIIDTLISGKYAGFIYGSYANEKSYDDALNIYADVVYKKILEKFNIKGQLLRFYWNMFYKNHNSKIHKDIPEKGFFSILYNLHTTDGGTEINNNFFPDVNGQAKVFNSFLDHKGIGPQKDNVRFNLNIVFKKI
jgi:hypothetical protein